MGVEIVASKPLLARGTINAGGTLSNEIDLGDMILSGLIFSTTPVNGTITFQVASQADDGVNVRYVDLYDDAGAVVSATLPAAKCAISALITVKIAGYRYIKIKSSVQQTNGLAIEIPGHA